MRWRGRRGSENVEDRRGMGTPTVVGGGIGMLVLALVVSFLGGDPRQLLQNAQQAQQGAAAGGQQQQLSAEDKTAGEFASVVFADCEEVWTDLFAGQGQKYKKPVMVLFSGATTSGCGRASSGTGPFYCPADERVYLDTSFFRQLSQQLGAPGDFAQAYVIAHEVGHHVQNVLGYTDEMEKIRRTQNKVTYNKYSVALELQADFFAGVALHHAHKRYNTIEPGDVEEALRAAKAIGDDTLQMRSQGYVQPESFNHGTSEQRLAWLTKGLQTGDISQGNTFDALRSGQL